MNVVAILQGRGAAASIAGVTETIGRILVVEALDGDKILPLQAREVLDITAPHCGQK